ncbi:MAG: DUF3341 domain-containing protein [Sphingobacteriia bacterium]|nr:DUF3341 domain-containing protein [Sphingobacteriia bacterium]
MMYSPFAIHGMDDALGLKRTRLTVAAFIYGVIGMTLGLSMMIFMNVIDWPINIGGKPAWMGPDFVPVTFEITVLITALGMVGTFLYINRLGPGVPGDLIDPRVTNDRFIIAVEVKADETRSKITEILQSHGSLEIRERSK